MVRNIQARRKLSDLYRRGVEIRFNPEGPEFGPFEDPATEDQIAIWVGPPSPLQRDMAMREASAARARAILAVKRDEDSEEHLTALNFVVDMGHETIVDYVLLGTQEERKHEAIREVLAEEEWKNFTELQDAMRQFDEDQTPEDDPEFAALIERDAEYGRQVNARFMEITEASRETLLLQKRQELERQALEKRGELVGSQRFMEAFESWMVFYSVRDPESRDTLWYDTPQELRSDDQTVQDAIRKALALFIQDPAEAKNSSGAASGLDSLVPPNAPETSAPSIPEAASA